jgi:hypothetical protein
LINFFANTSITSKQQQQEKFIKMSVIPVDKLSVFPLGGVDKCIASCDEQIVAIQKKVHNMKPYIIGQMVMMKLYDWEEYVKVCKEAPKLDKVRDYENDIKLIKVEKMMWNALKNNRHRVIFKHILSKYDELMRQSYDINSNMVLNGIQAEGDYLDYCREKRDHRECMRKMCSAGFQGYLE